MGPISQKTMSLLHIALQQPTADNVFKLHLSHS